MVNIQKSSEKKPAPAPARAGDVGGSLMGLRHEMERLFDDFMHESPWGGRRRGWFDLRPAEGFGHLMPSLDLSETDGAYKVSAELPGMDEKDIELSIDNGMLTIKGEKREEKEEKTKESYVSERRYGSVHRTIAVPEGVDEDKIKASFEKGVLKLTLPKSAAKKKSAKKIAIR